MEIQDRILLNMAINQCMKETETKWVLTNKEVQTDAIIQTYDFYKEIHKKVVKRDDK